MARKMLDYEGYLLFAAAAPPKFGAPPLPVSGAACSPVTDVVLLN